MPLKSRFGAQQIWLTAATVLSLICYYQLIYHIQRHDFPTLLFYFGILTTIYLLVIRIIDVYVWYWALAAAFAFRLMILPAIPEWSDDFYRFIWDGRLLVQGVSPFSQLPSQLILDVTFSQDLINQELFQGMNSPDYFTVYPPLAQWVFYLAAKVSPDSILGSIIFMRLIVLLAEAGTIVLILKLLKEYDLPSTNTLIYAWNPLVIIELTGNLHFEAVMIFFILLAIYLIKAGRQRLSAAALGAAIATKLVPLIFLPLIIRRKDIRQVLTYWLICGVVVAGCFLTIWNEDLWAGMSSSLGLYFQKFEFNASIYYLVREAGFAITGYNIIQTAGSLMAFVTLLLILWLAWTSYKRFTWPQAMLWALTLYLLMSTTVHPWYITTIVALAAITNYWFPVAWSVLIILSYAGYTETGYHENMLLVVTEYLLLGVVILWEMKRHDYGRHPK